MPPVPVYSNTLRTLGFVQSLANQCRSLNEIVIDSSLVNTGTIVCGTVLGKISSSGKYVPSPQTGSDGSQTAIAVLFDDFDTAFDPSANYGGVTTAVVRSAEVRAEDLTYDPSVTTLLQQEQKWAQLLACGIVVRTMGGVQVAND
jgi:hypothetical protein